MTAETSNARGELRMADIREDAREPLQLLREKLAHDEDGWAALCRLMPMLAAAPPPAAAQQGQAVAECHCATCTCAPGMTPAVRFDTSPAAQEGAIRDHLIALGWTPPGAQQKGQLDVGSPRTPEQIAATVAWVQSLADSDTAPQPMQQGGREVVAWMTPGGDVSRSFYWCLERCLPGQEPQPLYAAPPSAPVGVEAIAAEIRASLGRGATVSTRRRWAVELEALAQRPAAVDGAMVFRLAAWMAKQDGHDDPHHLIWEGSPPEPWGEIWMRYEDDARAALTAAFATQHKEPKP